MPNDLPPIDWQGSVTKPDYSDLRETYHNHLLTRIDGYAATPHGYVKVEYRIYSDQCLLEMSIIRDGTQYSRHWVGPRKKRTICILATKFAQDIAERTPTP